MTALESGLEGSFGGLGRSLGGPGGSLWGLGGLGAPFGGFVVLLDANMAEKGNKRLKE